MYLIEIWKIEFLRDERPMSIYILKFIAVRFLFPVEPEYHTINLQHLIPKNKTTDWARSEESHDGKS